MTNDSLNCIPTLIERLEAAKSEPNVPQQYRNGLNQAIIIFRQYLSDPRVREIIGDDGLSILGGKE